MKDFNKDNYAKDYLKDISTKLPGYYLMFDLLFKGVLPIELNEANRIMTIGGGEIELNELVNSYPNTQIDVIDNSEKMIEFLKSLNISEDISFYLSDFNKSSIDDQYDLILSLLVIHFVDDKKTFLKKVYDRLDDNGVFIISAFSNEQLNWWKEYSINIGANQEEVNNTYKNQASKMNSISSFDIEQLLKETGFNRVEKMLHIFSIDMWIIQK